MFEANVTNKMNRYFDLHHVVRRLDSGKIVSTDDALRTFFGRVVKGNPYIYDTPFARGESTPQLLKAWMETLVSIDKKWPSLYAYEINQMSKVGPMSIVQPLKNRMQDIKDYYTGILLPGRPIENWATWDVQHKLQKMRGLRIRSEKRTIEKMKKSSNSGAPYFSKRKTVVDFASTDIGISHIDGSVWMMSDGNYKYNPVATLGWRGQEGGPMKEDVKQRVVWMFPFEVNVLELMVYQPLIEAAQNTDAVPAWVSMDRVDEHITKLFDTKGSDDLIICTDFTKFDQHFNRFMRESAEETIDWLFNSRSMQFWLNTIFPIKYQIPMMYNYGRAMFGEHGMGSGSGGTNADETLAHMALQMEVAGLHDATLNPNSMCLGDDGVLSYPGITVKDVTDAYQSHGLEMNESKQYASTNECIYLKRWHHTDYRIAGVCAGVYSTMRALGRLRYLEKYYDPDVWGPKAVALRQLSILENVKYHPLRNEFAEFCMKRDKFRLGIDIPDFLSNIENEAQIVIDLMPDFLGYTKSLQAGEDNPARGISEWWIVKYLRSR